MQDSKTSDDEVNILAMLNADDGLSWDAEQYRSMLRLFDLLSTTRLTILAPAYRIGLRDGSSLRECREALKDILKRRHFTNAMIAELFQETEEPLDESSVAGGALPSALTEPTVGRGPSRHIMKHFPMTPPEPYEEPLDESSVAGGSLDGELS